MLCAFPLKDDANICELFVSFQKKFCFLDESLVFPDETAFFFDEKTISLLVVYKEQKKCENRKGGYLLHPYRDKGFRA